MMWQKFTKTLSELHRDEQGADMVEYILIVAAIGLPLLGVLIWFWGDIKEWIIDLYEETKTDVEEASSVG
ncbi:MAG: Flp family type IVb pilin [Planctomycetota bacterium]